MLPKNNLIYWFYYYPRKSHKVPCELNLVKIGISPVLENTGVRQLIRINHFTYFRLSLYLHKANVLSLIINYSINKLQSRVKLLSHPNILHLYIVYYNPGHPAKTIQNLQPSLRIVINCTELRSLQKEIVYFYLVYSVHRFLLPVSNRGNGSLGKQALCQLYFVP